MYCWKDLFLLQNLSIDDNDLDQKVMMSEVEQRPGSETVFTMLPTHGIWW